jgi:CRP/FNR family transcriptional regulator, cyclic AMP receptor protein
MEKQVLAQLLRQLHFSATLPDSVLDHLASSAKVLVFPAHSQLFCEGAKNDQLMIVCSGRVALDLHVPGQGNVRILTMGPGELLAWSALLAEGRMTTSATALDDTKVVSISTAELTAACDTDHSFGYFLMRQMAVALAERLTATRGQLIDLLTFNQAVEIRPPHRA